MLNKKIICFDIGGTKILKSVVKIRGGKYEFLEIEEEKNPRREEKIKKIILEHCQAARKKYWTKKVAVSAAYIVDQEKKIINQGKSCYGVDMFDLKFLEKEGFSIRVENDGRCFALGEYKFGKAKKTKSVLALSIGTGIGGSFVLDGENFRGAHSSSLEVSHIWISNGERWKKWWEFSSGSGIEKMYNYTVKEKDTARDIFEAAKRKNKDAITTIKQASLFLGMGTGNLMTILDPEVIIFGGSLSKQRKFISDAVKIAKKNAFNKKANYKFAISSLGNRANLLGAASLYF